MHVHMYVRMYVVFPNVSVLYGKCTASYCTLCVAMCMCDSLLLCLSACTPCAYLRLPVHVYACLCLGFKGLRV